MVPSERIAKSFRKPLHEAQNYRKQKVKVARIHIHEKIHHARTDYLHKINTNIVKNYDIIGIENLQVSHMLKNHNLVRSIREVSWSTFRTTKYRKGFDDFFGIDCGTKTYFQGELK
jgi:putative transposase